jgi:type IV pilus assembly protein PilB
MVLLTGPTGSGKTTTLYGALNQITSSEKNIVTVEDPVEYQLKGIYQMQANPAIGLTFAAGLRAILRQDPDIIMVGEIRDQETASSAIRCALTGHLVLSTLHTNDTASTAVRLMDMGVEPFLLSSTLVGIVAQRVVRRICEDCAEDYEPPLSVLEPLGLGGREPRRLRRGRGCRSCRGTGYRGRTAVFEVLEATEAFRSALGRSAGADELRRISLAEGMRTLRMNTAVKVLGGITTPEEMAAVTMGME